MDLLSADVLSDYVRQIFPDLEDIGHWPDDANRFYSRIETFTLGLILGIALMKPLRFPDEGDDDDNGGGEDEKDPSSGGSGEAPQSPSYHDPTTEELQHVADAFRQSNVLRGRKKS